MNTSFDTTPLPSGPAAGGAGARKKWLILGAIAVIIIAAVVGIVLWARASTDQEGTAQYDSIARVTIDENGLTPQIIKVKKGQTILWTNADSKPHQVTADEGGPDMLTIDNPMLPNSTFSTSLDQIGTFTYHDATNLNGFKGTVIVEAN